MECVSKIKLENVFLKNIEFNLLEKHRKFLVETCQNKRGLERLEDLNRNDL